MNWQLLTFFLTSSIVLTISPGPDILYVLSVSMQQGKKKALQLMWGLTSGLFFHTALVAFGWSQLLVSIPSVRWGIKVLGSGYLVYLAIRSLRKPNQLQTHAASHNRNYFRQGLLMNLTNPKVTLFFMVFFPGFLFSDRLSYGWQFSILGILFWMQAVFIFSLVARLGAEYQNSRFFKVTQKYHHIIEGIFLFVIATVLLTEI